VERKSGLIFADYTYSGKTGDELKLKRGSDTLYLVQVHSRNSYSYGYIDFVAPDRHVVLVADIMSKGPYLDSLMKANEVQIRGHRNDLAILAGTTTKVLGYLMAHDKSLLMAVGDCKRQV
jgi:hypothetical protein